MYKKVKKAVSILSAIFISAGLLAGCGSSGTTAAVNDTTSSVTTAEADHRAEVTLISFAGKTLKVTYEDKEYTLDISKPKSSLSFLSKIPTSMMMTQRRSWELWRKSP